MTGSVSAWGVWARGRGAGLGLAAAAGLAACIALLPLRWAALSVLGGLVAVGILMRPQVGLLLLVLTVPFGSVFEVQIGVMRVGVTEALAVWVLLAWWLRLTGGHSAKLRWPRPALALGLFLGSGLVSLVGAESAAHGIKELIKWTEVLGLYLFVVHMVDRRWLKPLTVALLAAGALAALQGIYQFLFQVGPEAFVLFGRFMRAHGSFGQPNPFAGYLGMTLPLAVGLVVGGALRHGGEVSWRWCLYGVVAGSMMLTALIMSWSRGGWLGAAAAVMAISTAVVVCGRPGLRILFLVAFLLGYLALIGGLVRIPPALSQRLVDFAPDFGLWDVRGVEITDTNYAVLERMAHWQAAWGMFSEHPWFGVGIGNYEPAYSRYAMPMWPEALGHAHNYYLNVAAEMGLTGLLAYLALVGVTLARAWRATRVSCGWAWGLATGVLGALTHLAVHNTVDNLYVHDMYLQFAVLVGITTVLVRGSSGHESVSCSG